MTTPTSVEKELLNKIEPIKGLELFRLGFVQSIQNCEFKLKYGTATPDIYAGMIEAYKDALVAYDALCERTDLLLLITKQARALEIAREALQVLVKPLGEPHHSHSDADLVDMLQQFSLSMKVEAKEALTKINEALK